MVGAAGGLSGRAAASAARHARHLHAKALFLSFFANRSALSCSLKTPTCTQYGPCVTGRALGVVAAA